MYGLREEEEEVRLRGIGLSLAFLSLVVVADQLSKWLAVWMDFGFTENRGIAFGLFPSFDWVFLLAAVVLGLGWFLRVKKFSSPLTSVGLGLFIGGGSSNLVDRVVRGSVFDFLWIGIGPRFNLADFAITFGLALLSWSILVGKDRVKAQ